MRLASFVTTDDIAATVGPRTGLLVGDEVVDLTDSVVGLPGDMAHLLAAGPGALDRAAGAAATAAVRHPLAAITLLAPVPRPAKVMGLGMNYGAHVAEMGRPRPAHQVWFNKQRTCVVGPSAAIEVPRASPQVDYEGELAFVIGRRCRHVPAAEAPSVVAGFSIMNDVSVRDWQWRSPTWTLGKSFDTHGPLGPWLVTPDETGDPHRLRLRTWVNDELRQDSSTDDMIFSCWEMVEELSTVFTLEPGDVVSTGTPAGVGASFDPPKWLLAGDTVRIEIDGLGVLENPVIDEKPAPRP
ncbi:MAG TPA: fumarylacetoacetate hydrolase family protein [Acidimicrobiales bacterium]|nr:fumarylacetoacetate hydrolase family protein [Acidimicrobiales bacterium]